MINESEDKNDFVQVRFDLSDITNEFLFQIKETTESISRIFQAIDNLKNEDLLHKPLPSDSFPILINDKGKSKSATELREETINWAIRKGFEDFIIGLSKSFKETYRYLSFRNIASDSDLLLTEEELNKKLDKIEKVNEKLSVPGFIEEIEKLLGQELPLKKELKSINKVRNCLVHRHGIVKEKDLHNDSSTLKLCWLDAQYWSVINGKKVYVTYDKRKEGLIIDNLSSKIIECDKSFRRGEEIILDINEFNGIAFTCAEYARRIYDIIPKNNI